MRRATFGFKRLKVTVERAEPAPRPEATAELQLTGPVDLRLQDRSDDIAQTVAEYKQFFARSAPGEGTTLAERVGAVSWYHTIELPGVVTPGVYDHRDLLPHYGLPESLSGMRCLDAGTWDGFWAFEMERRGGQVTALDVARMSEVDLPAPVRDAIIANDVDPPTGAGFRLAHEALGSSVERLVSTVYDLSPERIGTFDLVHMGDLLLHLESPLAGLRALRSVCSGRAIICDCYDAALPVGPTLTSYRGGWRNVHWWMPALDTLGQMIVDAGFRDVTVHNTYVLPFHGGSGTPWSRAVVHARA